VRYRLAALIGFEVAYMVASDDSIRGWQDLAGRSVAAVGRTSRSA